MEEPGIDLLHLVFNKQLVDKQLALAWQIAKQLSGLNSLSLSNNRNYSLKVTPAATSPNVSSEAQVKNFFIS